jgi:hypothetical protein
MTIPLVGCGVVAIWWELSNCPTITENELKTVPYSTRLKEMDRVGLFEPTTSATTTSQERQLLK